MAKRATRESIAAELPTSARVFLFCLASGTDWQSAGVTAATAQVMLVRGLVDRDPGNRYRLTEEGRAVLSALLGGAG